VVKVPDARVDALSNLYKPKKTTYAEIAFSDVAAAPARGEGQGWTRRPWRLCARWMPSAMWCAGLLAPRARRRGR